MKNILIIILLILSTNRMFACRCANPNITQRIIQSDFVATAKIIKVTTDTFNSTYDNIKIEIIELYKGQEIKNIKITRGCMFSVSEHTTWLIYAAKDNNGILSFGYCSGAKQIDRKFNSTKYPAAKEQYDAGIESQLAFLSFVKDNKIELINEYNLSASLLPMEYFNFRRLVYDNSYTKSLKGPILFQLTINKNLKIKKVKILQSLEDRRIQKILINYLKMHLQINQNENLKEIPRKTEIIYEL